MPAHGPKDPILVEISESLLDRVDRRLALIIGGSLALHLGIAAYAWAADIEQPAPLQAPVATTYQDIDIVIPDLAPPPIETPTTSHAPGITAVQPARPSPTIAHRPTSIGAPPGPSHVDVQQLAGMLTSGDTTETARPHLELTEHEHVSIGEGTHTSRIDDDVHIGTHEPAPIVDDPTIVHVPDPRTEHPLPGRIVPGPVTPEPGTTTTTLTPALVLARIQSTYMPGLQRCYRLGLAADAELSGKVAVSFTVDDHGQVTEPDANGVSPGVESCVRTQMSRWTFPIPHDHHGAPTDASFSLSLALQPS